MYQAAKTLATLVVGFYTVWWDVHARLTLTEFLTLYAARELKTVRMTAHDVVESAERLYGALLPHAWYVPSALRTLTSHGCIEEQVLGMKHRAEYDITDEGRHVLACYLRRMGHTQ